MQKSLYTACGNENLVIFKQRPPTPLHHHSIQPYGKTGKYLTSPPPPVILSSTYAPKRFPHRPPYPSPSFTRLYVPKSENINTTATYTNTYTIPSLNLSNPTFTHIVKEILCNERQITKNPPDVCDVSDNSVLHNYRICGKWLELDPIYFQTFSNIVKSSKILAL